MTRLWHDFMKDTHEEFQTEMNDMILECVTRLMNNMVPSKEKTNLCYCQPLEAYRGKQTISKHDVSNYGY